MKTKLCVLFLCLGGLAGQGQTNHLDRLLRKGLFQEQASQDLNAAINTYQLLLTQFDKDRQLAATAVFRLGECYRELGKTNEAIAQYQRILREYPDQGRLATLSRQDLAALGSTPPPSMGTRSSAAGLWDQVKALPRSQLENVLPVLVPDPILTRLQEQRNETENKLAQEKVDLGPSNPAVAKLQTTLKVLNSQITSRIDGVLQALKLQAQISGNGTGAPASGDEQDAEIQRLQDMIRNSPDLINHASGNGGTPLFNAASKGQLRVARFLLDHGADVNASAGPSLVNPMPLMTAADHGHKAMVQLLLDHGAEVDVRNHQQDTALHLAAIRGFQAVVKALLDHRADVNARDSRGDTPLLLAVRSGNDSIVDLLLARGAKAGARNSEGESALTLACASGVTGIVKSLLAAGANPELAGPGGRTPLSFAVQGGSKQVIKMLLAAKVDPNAGQLDPPLLVAIHEQDVASAQLLLQSGANPNASGVIDLGHKMNRVNRGSGVRSPLLTPLSLAISMSELPMVKTLLKFKADPNDSLVGGRPVAFSALGDTNILDVLLEAGANPDSRLPASAADGPGKGTLLELAVSRDHASTVQTLLDHGANPNLRDAGGNTALHYAAMRLASQEIFDLLLDHKADPNVRNNAGLTAMDIVTGKEKGRAQPYTSSPFPRRAARPFFMSRPGSIIQPAHPPKLAGEIAGLLRQHGALDNQIEVSRPSAHFTVTVFRGGTNDWNRFTLLEAILNFYGSGRSYQVQSAPGGFSVESASHSLPFPDLSRVVIVRPERGTTNFARIKVDLLNATNGIDVSKDVPLQFGDVVEIPERNHALGEQRVGLTNSQREAILNHLKGKAELVTHQHKVELPLSPFPNDSLIGPVLSRPAARNALLSSSDLEHVKVIRRDAKTGERHEWTVDCSDPNRLPDLWLRDGDVVEVPEKKR